MAPVLASNTCSRLLFLPLPDPEVLMYYGQQQNKEIGIILMPTIQDNGQTILKSLIV